MVRALRARRKTQTRRIVKPQPSSGVRPSPFVSSGVEDGHGREQRCPYGAPGDRLVVKEASWIWCERRPNGKTKTGRAKYLYVPVGRHVVYCADGEKPTEPTDHEPDRLWRWKAGRFMPSWASRLTLVVESVRIERVQAISEEDAKAEGVEPLAYRVGEVKETNHRYGFERLWSEINGAESWDADPRVWVVGFSIEEQAQQARAA